MDNTNAAIDISVFIPQDISSLEIMKPGGIEGTGWHVQFAGPAHPKTVAWNNEQNRKNLRRSQQIEQAQVNGKKFKSEDRDVDEVRRDNVAWVVARIVDWTPVRLGPGDPVAFAEEAAIRLLMQPNMGWAFSQMIEFLVDERSFTKGSATNSEPSQNTSSFSEQ